MSHPPSPVIAMPYTDLRRDFDATAADLFGNGYMMTSRERLSRVQELHGLALQVLAAAQDRPDAIKIGASIAAVIRHANSMTTAATHAEILRERYERARLGQPVCF